MTRINVGIDPTELPDKLLLAEHREITRIPNAVRNGRASLSSPLPLSFSLGSGHVRFFYDRLAYLRSRYRRLLAECRSRGFIVADKSTAFDLSSAIFRGLRKSYKPTADDRRIIVERIESKGFRLKKVPRE